MAYPTKADHPQRLLAKTQGALRPGCRLTITHPDGTYVAAWDFEFPSFLDLVAGRYIDASYRWFVTLLGQKPHSL